MNPRTLTVRVDCPKCGNAMEVQAVVTGAKRDRDPEYVTPEGHSGCGPFTTTEVLRLSDVLYDEALDADRDAQRAEDGPDDSDLPSWDDALYASLRARGAV